MKFKEAVTRTPCLGAARYHPGKQALGTYSNQVRCSDTRRFTGSVNLNEAFPHCEWDYGIGFRVGREEIAIWIEPHPASATSEVSKFIGKVEWLKKWLQNEAKDLWDLTRKVRKQYKPYFWLATGSVHIFGEDKRKKLARHGISFPRKVIEL